MKRFGFDLWDVGAVLALSALLCGVGFVYWPAALILGGGAFLWVYYHREKSIHAAQSAPRR